MNDNELNEFLRHQLYLDRLATGQLNAVIYPSLEASYKAIAGILESRGIPTTPAQLKRLIAEINKQIMSESGFATVTLSMAAMAEYEAIYQADLSARAYESSIVAPAVGAATSLAAESLIVLTSGARVDAGIWGDFIQSNLSGRAATIDGIVKQGYARSQSLSQITKSIKESFEGILKREAESLVRTGFVHYAANASEAMILQNQDILKEYYYVVTFDNRTSPICQGITRFNKVGNRFKVGDPRAPMPPLHFGCRTRRIASPAGWVPDGTRSAVSGVNSASAKAAFEKRDAKGKKVKYRGKKDTNIFNPSQVDAGLNYEQWLRKQPDWFIKDSLGAKRAELFTAGTPLNKFSDMTGKPLTLAQIKEREQR